MATPLVQSVGTTSGAGTIGEGRNDLVNGETVNLSDTEALNSGASYLWTFEDIPIGSASTMINATTATPSFVVDVTSGSYRVNCLVDGADTVTEVFAVPLPISGGRIPSFEEELEYDASGNAKGWHYSMTLLLRSMDALIGAAGTTLDGAYDFGGAGAGRAIVADSGPVTITNPNVDAANVLELTTTALGTGAALSITNAGDGLAISASPDTDQSFVLGRARIDSRVTDHAYFSHFDHTASTAFALAHLPSGETYLNGNGGAGIRFLSAGVTSFIMDGSNIRGTNGGGIRNSAPSATNPTVTPNYADPDSGLAWVSADIIALTTGATEALRIDASQDSFFAGNLAVNSSAVTANPLSIDQGNQTNVYGIRLHNVGAGTSGIQVAYLSGSFELGWLSGASVGISSTNRSMQFSVTNNAFDAATQAYHFTQSSVPARTTMRVRGDALQTAEILNVHHLQVDQAELVGLLISNDAVAAAGAQQHAPMFVQQGSGWKTDATAGPQTVAFAQQVIPIQGTASPTGELVFKSSINAGAYTEAARLTSVGQLLLQDGLPATTPPLAAAGDTNTGVYWPAADTLGLVTAGSVRVRLEATQMAISYLGSASAAAISTLGDRDTGPFWVNPDIFAITTGATEAVRWNASQQTLVPDGSSSLPSYAFAAATTTGMYSTGSSIAFAVATQVVAELQTDEIRINRPIRMTERATAMASNAGLGQLWVDNNVAQTLYFTDDAGVDFPIGGALGGGGLTSLSVVNIDDSSTELNAISGSAKGDMRLVYQTVAGTDEWTMYAWDDADSGAESVPTKVDGLTGMWSAVGGKYNSGSIIAAPGEGGSFVFGDVRIDARQTNQAYFSHYDLPGVGNYALKQHNSEVTYLNTGFGTVGRLEVATAVKFYWGATELRASTAGGGAIMNEVGSRTNPTLVNYVTDYTTGIGGVTGEVSIITGATEAAYWDASQNTVLAGGLFLAERAAGEVDQAGYGQIWAKTDNTLWFTAEDGTDTQLGLGGAHPDPHLLGYGTVGAPTYSFASAPTTGIWGAATSVNLAAAGTTVLIANTNYTRFAYTTHATQPRIAVGGIVSGIGYPTLDYVSIITSSIEAVHWDTSQVQTNAAGILANAGNNETCVFGQARIYTAAGTGATFAHENVALSTGYALYQNSAGFTRINALSTIDFSTSTSARFTISSTALTSAFATGPAIANENSTATNPVFNPVKTDLLSGLGGIASTPSMITASVERQRWSANTTGLPVSTITRDAIGVETATTDLDNVGLMLVNTTDASALGEEFSPALVLGGETWIGSTNWNRWSMQAKSVGDAAPPADNILSFSGAVEGINAGAFYEVMRLTTRGATNGHMEMMTPTVTTEVAYSFFDTPTYGMSKDGTSLTFHAGALRASLSSAALTLEGYGVSSTLPRLLIGTGNGIGYPAGSSISIITGSTQAALFDSNQAATFAGNIYSGIDGSSTLPAIARSDNTGTGIWWGASGVMGFATDGTNHVTLTEIGSAAKRAQFIGQVGAATGTITSSSSMTMDCDTGNTQFLDLAHTTATMNNPTNLQDGFIYYLIIKQNTASRTITSWGSKFKWVGGSAPTLSTTAGRYDRITMQYLGGEDVLIADVELDIY